MASLNIRKNNQIQRALARGEERITSWEILPLGKIFIPLLSSSVEACSSFSVRFTLMADTIGEYPALHARVRYLMKEAEVTLTRF